MATTLKPLPMHILILIAARVSLIFKSKAISVRSPMGINSDVLNTKTANVRPIKGNQEVNEFFNCIIIKRVIVVLKQLCNEYKLIVF